MKGFGAVSDGMMRELITNGNILGVMDAPTDTHINPASFDLSITKAYRLEYSILPKRGQSVKKLLEKARAKRVPLQDTTFEPEVTYCFKTSARILLPPGYYAHFNPKSSSGRDAWLIRTIIDGVDVYDALPSGMGEFVTPWLLARPTKMPIEMSPGETLAQARIFNKDTRFSAGELLHIHETEHEPFLLIDGKPIPWKKIRTFTSDRSVGVSLDLRPGTQIGWRCRENKRIVKYSEQQEKELYFEPVYADVRGGLLLEKGYFYILSTMESVRVPPWMACEVVPAHSWLGEVRIHAAGYIDPGWGYGEDGEGVGRRITLEVWPQENLYVQKRQLVGLLHFEQMIEVPLVHYDRKPTSHYQHQQGALPSKRFK